jgi:hypothetical protein
MERISAPEQTREHLRALIEGRLGTAPARSSLVLLAARRAPRRVATRFIVHILVALALAAGLHAPAARFLSILCVGHPS